MKSGYAVIVLRPCDLRFIVVLQRGVGSRDGNVYLGQCPTSGFGNTPSVSRVGTLRDVGLRFHGEQGRVCSLQGTACSNRTTQRQRNGRLGYDGCRWDSEDSRMELRSCVDRGRVS